MTYFLLTNDDGVHAPGLRALAAALRPLATELQVIAPAHNQSMSGHKITLFQDIQVDENLTFPDGTPAVAVHGSPADCINLASHGLVNWPPRLVISGINRGANLSQDIFYSGTVSAALEAAVKGIPALAVSLDSTEANDEADYADAAQAAAQVVAQMLKYSLPPFSALNLNVPYGVPVKGIRVTRMGVRIYLDQLSRKGNTVRIDGEKPTGVVDELGTDVWAVHNGYASLTPLMMDFTAHPFMADLVAWGIE
ncbi:MAG: 5'/3'-nucleotidase SurE [Phototrophicaceae bacterium]|jgi:5'-nucleotidase